MTELQKRKVYFISDGTGITAESLGQSLLTQFDNIKFEIQTLPYINTAEKANEVITTINKHVEQKPIVFSTLVNQSIRSQFQKASFLCMDLFHSFISPLEQELGMESSHTMGKTHGVNVDNYNNYMLRMNAVNYVLSNDDGANIHDYSHADVILIGVSRCGKTPTCLYLAMQFGIHAANYPITEDEINMSKLPEHLKAYKKKIFGLTIDPNRLSLIRQERRPNSQYANPKQCQYEVREVEMMFKKEKLGHINTTSRSIEEISTRIMSACKLRRRLI